jgi:TolB protein
MVGGDTYEHAEIFTLGVDGGDLQRLTDNTFWDLYPAWSPDGSQIAFLSWRDADLDVYVMDADGGNQALLHDSGSHDADIHWVDDQIVFTSGSRIWVIQGDGTGARRVTDPPRAGEWGNANLPFGDYDPRISPDGARVLFTRLVGDESPHGNYDFYIVDSDGSSLTRLTETGYTQGLASWSRAGDRIAFVVSAIEGVGQYDIYTMNADGAEVRNITPATFPPDLLCHSAVFSRDDTTVYFVGEWWSED